MQQMSSHNNSTLTRNAHFLFPGVLSFNCSTCERGTGIEAELGRHHMQYTHYTGGKHCSHRYGQAWPGCRATRATLEPDDKSPQGEYTHHLDTLQRRVDDFSILPQAWTSQTLSPAEQRELMIFL
jgi:hypothetical protein